jgi:hypothetical protein
MPAFDDAKFTEALTTQAVKVLGVPDAAAVPLDWMSILTGLLGSLFTGCMGAPTPTPVAPATSIDIAAQLKGANFIQKAALRNRIRKEYIQAGKTRKDGDNAFQTVLNTVSAAPVSDIAQAIDHARQDANETAPLFEMG